MRGRSTVLWMLMVVAAAGVVAALVQASAPPPNTAPTAARPGEKQLNLHRHGVAIRVARAAMPSGGVQVRIFALPASTPDLVELLKPTSAQLQHSTGQLVALQMQADGSLGGSVPVQWLQSGVPHIVRLQAWSGNRQIADVGLDYLLP